MNKLVLLSLTLMHFLVDALCICCMCLLIDEMRHWPYGLVFIVYNGLAFLTQPLTGWLVDKNKCDVRSYILALALLLLAGTLALSVENLSLPLSGLLVLAIAGIGNSFFHVYGGKYVAVKSQNDIRYLGVFVSSGALGLYVGKANFSSGFLLGLMSVMLCVGVAYVWWIRQKHEVVLSEEDYDRNEEMKPIEGVGKNVLWFFIFLLFIVFLRSFMGQMLPHSADSLWFGAGAITLMAFLGKMGGGYLARYFGDMRTLLWTLLLACVCFVFRECYSLFVLLMILFINISMPITLYLSNRCFPRREGFAFGMLAFILLPGFALGSYCVEDYLAYHLMFPLFETILIETLVLLLIKERRWSVLGISLLMNILTNVPLNLSIWLCEIPLTPIYIIVLEVAVVIVESVFYYLVLRNYHKALLYSLLCNATSYLVGLLVQTIFV